MKTEQQTRCREYYQINIDKERERKREYYIENKEDVCARKKESRDKDIEKSRELERKYYKKNQEAILKKKLDYAKKTNYKASRKFQKKPEVKELNKIRDKTKRLYPLRDKMCNFCNLKAEEHHHNTLPYLFDKFDYVCKDCHKKIHKEKRNVFLER